MRPDGRAAEPRGVMLRGGMRVTADFRPFDSRGTLLSKRELLFFSRPPPPRVRSCRLSCTLPRWRLYLFGTIFLFDPPFRNESGGDEMPQPNALVIPPPLPANIRGSR